MSELGDRLKELRASQSQRDMADPLGIKYQQWAKYERGEVSPGAEMLKQICLVHSCSADWLLGIDKLCNGRKVSVTATHGGIATVGNVSGTIVTPGESASCAKCPFKKKLQALEKVLGKS